MARVVWLVIGCLAFAGCGSTGNLGCTPTGFLFTAGPANAVVSPPDHTAAAPGNQEQFNAGVGALYGPGCATPQVIALTHVSWSASDAQNVRISSADDATNGLATCLGSTDGATVVTATYSKDGFNQQRATSITCK